MTGMNSSGYGLAWLIAFLRNSMGIETERMDFGISTGWEVGRVETSEDRGQISRMCGKTPFVLTDLAFQAG